MYPSHPQLHAQSKNVAMSRCIVLRGGLKSGDRVGAAIKKRVHFVDEANVSIITDNEGPTSGLKTWSLNEGTQELACGVDVNAQVADDLMQEGLHFLDSCQVTEGNPNAVKDASLSSTEKENWTSTTPPPYASYELASLHGVPCGSHLPVSGPVQRQLTFGVEPPASEEQCHSKFVFTHKKNLSRSQNCYKVAPEVEEGVLPMNDLHSRMQARGLALEDPFRKRCAWITPHSDAVYVAYHDEEWGLPVHEDRRLFELLVFAGAQAEIAWSTLLAKREVYRNVFAQFDPATLASYDIAKVASLRSHNNDMMRSEARVQSIVSNAKLVMKIVEEYGSLDAYLWGFVGNRPIVNRYKQVNLIPVRTGKSEAISKDLQRRGFRHAGPIVVYSLMQAAGLANDHLLSCFRHHALLQLPPSPTTRPHRHPPLRKRIPAARKPLRVACSILATSAHCNASLFDAYPPYSDRHLYPYPFWLPLFIVMLVFLCLPIE
ncbi:hypothetical protein GOP47_0004760 [Adiantum capillus-veneris]|uniref:DNA-3-methyladenine glycosylase I n=1 Tax=Adiantum capillus-veneris TaxID=13818 RepID=A0A9D4V4L7_ADICA|nr:hypothetical protein GOP47_0004760 [Adiantum capillus-veneris]